MRSKEQSAELKEKVRALRKEGMTYHGIAKELGISFGYASHICNKLPNPKDFVKHLDPAIIEDAMESPAQVKEPSNPAQIKEPSNPAQIKEVKKAEVATAIHNITLGNIKAMMEYLRRHHSKMKPQDFKTLQEAIDRASLTTKVNERFASSHTDSGTSAINVIEIVEASKD